MKTAIILVLTLIIIAGCHATLTFTEPQPARVNEIYQFPKRVQGCFFSRLDSSLLLIRDKSIVRISDYTFSETLPDNKRQLSEAQKALVAMISGGIVEGFNTDSLFNISADNILKKFKGYYFLNYRYKSNLWKVKKLALEKGIISIDRISSKDDICKLREITETVADTNGYQFHPTRKEFRKFIRKDGLDECEEFLRIKNSRNYIKQNN